MTSESEAAELLRQVSTATITMQLFKRGIRRTAMDGPMALAPEQARLVGPAYTLRFVPMREDIATLASLADPATTQRRAIEECPPGAVLVIDAMGVTNAGTVGDILAERLARRGVAGLVTDGRVRDAAGVVESGLPVWCGGAAAPASLTEMASADLQVPIGCGGVAVLPGDTIVADGDGAVVVPAALLVEVATAAFEQERHERFIALQVRSGMPTRGVYPPNDENVARYRAWVDAGEPDRI